MGLCSLHIITGLNDGGAEAVLHRLCTHDISHRHVVVSLMDEGKYGPLLRAAGVEVYCLNLPRGQIRPGALWRLWRLLRQLKPDVVQTWMYHGDLVGGVMARLAGIRPVVWGIRHSTLVPGKSSPNTLRVARLSARLSRRVPQCIVACAERAVEVHTELGYEGSRMVVIPNGYDLANFAPNDAARRSLRQEWCIPEGHALLGMVGRFDPQKDHANLLTALGQLQEAGSSFHCVLIGTEVTPDNTQLRELITRHGLEGRVHLLGRRDDIPAVMNALDLHVLPSSFGEAFPNVLAEAMACGTPCVTTEVGDAARIVGKTGWVVPPSNPGRLAEALQEALAEWQDPNRWQPRQAAARQRIVDHFSIETMVKAYHQVWQQARSCQD